MLYTYGNYLYEKNNPKISVNAIKINSFWHLGSFVYIPLGPAFFVFS